MHSNPSVLDPNTPNCWPIRSPIWTSCYDCIPNSYRGVSTNILTCGSLKTDWTISIKSQYYWYSAACIDWGSTLGTASANSLSYCRDAWLKIDCFRCDLVAANVLTEKVDSYKHSWWLMPQTIEEVYPALKGPQSTICVILSFNMDFSKHDGKS
jgi:hypothetical protein